MSKAEIIESSRTVTSKIGSCGLFSARREWIGGNICLHYYSPGRLSADAYNVRNENDLRDLYELLKGWFKA